MLTVGAVLIDCWQQTENLMLKYPQEKNWGSKQNKMHIFLCGFIHTYFLLNAQMYCIDWYDSPLHHKTIILSNRNNWSQLCRSWFLCFYDYLVQPHSTNRTDELVCKNATWKRSIFWHKLCPVYDLRKYNKDMPRGCAFNMTTVMGLWQ